MTDISYDWIIVGGGISGIAVAEILTRHGHTVLLIEKNSSLASETSKGFHEWVHSGALYTLVPDKLLTLRYLLGAADDLFEYYSSFQNMNLEPTANGLHISKNGWFNNDRILFKYRIRKFNPFWMSLVSRSINIIEQISQHDWLRRKAGSEYGPDKVNTKYWINHIIRQIRSEKKFYQVMSPDLTMNSRTLLQDLLGAAINKGLTIKLGEKVVKIEENNNKVSVETTASTFQSHNVVICSPDAIAEKYKASISQGYAPMAVVENIPEAQNSFVELDYNVKNCINLLSKGNEIGLIGGVTVNTQDEVQPYLNYLISEHKKRMPGMKVIGSYVGIKKELVSSGQSRNYLYHINQNSNRIWSIVLGKFTLAFSMAPEFYRRVYNQNPNKTSCASNQAIEKNIISKTAWQEIVAKNLEEQK